MKNSFGNNLKITVFGESHGPAIGAVIDGLASGIKIDRRVRFRQQDRKLIILKYQAVLKTDIPAELRFA